MCSAMPSFPLWFGSLFVMCSPAITSEPSESTQPRLWSIQQQSVYTVEHTQHPGGFPPAGAIKGAAHRRCDCRAFSREGSGRNRRENIWAWSMCRAQCSQTRAVTWLLCISTSCNFTEMCVDKPVKLQCVHEKNALKLWICCKSPR